MRLHRRYRTAAGVPVSVIAAASSTNGRANTVDTYREWESTEVADGDRLLLVTTTYFVPFQHCDAIRVFGLGRHRCGIDTIGVAPEYALTTTDHLMEIRSAVRSMRALHTALAGVAQ